MDLEDAGKESTLKPLSNIGGYSTVFQRGTSPCFILKEASSAPKILNLRGKSVKSLTKLHTDACDRGFAYIDVDVSSYNRQSALESVFDRCRVIFEYVSSQHRPDMAI